MFELTTNFGLSFKLLVIALIQLFGVYYLGRVLNLRGLVHATFDNREGTSLLMKINFIFITSNIFACPLGCGNFTFRVLPSCHIRQWNELMWSTPFEWIDFYKTKLFKMLTIIFNRNYFNLLFDDSKYK